LAKHGYLSGLTIGKREMLWCATEMNTEEEIRSLSRTILSILSEIKEQTKAVPEMEHDPDPVSISREDEEVQV
ncbi:MAG: hypothetical protein LUG56_00840, partial [Lachnospiraceae bacterium]|nr:hypothetical protein [Lachnospiraceae bacterium]